MKADISGLRILMTTDAVGGVWVFATSLARELCKRGAQVSLVTLGPTPRPEQSREFEAVAGLQLHVTDLELEWTDPEGADLGRAIDLLTALSDQFGPNIVHLNGHREALAEWNAPIIVTSHSCVRTWWLACRGKEPTETAWQIYADNIRRGLNAADAWSAPSASHCAAVKTLYKPRSQGRAIYNGIDPIECRGEKEPFIHAAGRMWDEGKNITLLQNIAGTLSWPLKFAGASSPPAAGVDGEPTGELHRADLLKLMSRAGIFVGCPKYEPFGLSILEAAASGCALVLSDIPTLRELWDGAALFADPGTKASFVQAINTLCRDSDVRRRMQRAAKIRASHFSLDKTVNSYARLYLEFASLNHPPLAGPTIQPAEIVQ